MGELVNLRRVHKQISKIKKRRQSAVNAKKFGRNKVEIAAETKRLEQARQRLDGHLRDRDG